MQGLEDRYLPPERFATASDQLHDVVADKLGEVDFGPDDYLPGLRMLLLSMDFDPQFSAYGRRVAWGSLISALTARAHAAQSMKRTPGFDKHPILDPVVITGIPRTGTTALHKLMAVDPQFQGLQGWLIATPMPRPPRESWAGNPVFQEAVERLALRFSKDPSKRAAHDMAADELDECGGVLRQGFVSNIWTCGWPSATYDLWWQTHSEAHCYEHYYRTCQLIGSAEPAKKWLLKNPGHIDNLDLLFATFPRATVIQTHRDPAKAVPSLCALLMKSHAMIEDGRTQMRATLMCIRETEKWSNALRKAEPVRRAHASQILDVVHGDFHAQPIAMIERIYDFAGLTLTPEVRAAMMARIAAAPERQYGEHRYSVSEFETTEEAIRERFGDYIERFDLKPGRAAA